MQLSSSPVGDRILQPTGQHRRDPTHSCPRVLFRSVNSPTNQLLTLRLLSGSFIGAIAVFIVIMAVIAPDTTLPDAWVIAVLLGLVAVAALLSALLPSRVPPATPVDSVAAMMVKVQPVHIMRLVLMEFPAILSIALMFISPEPSWVTVAIAAVPTVLLMVLLVFPHAGVLRRYETALDAGGVRTRFTDRLLNHEP